ARLGPSMALLWALTRIACSAAPSARPADARTTEDGANIIDGGTPDAGGGEDATSPDASLPDSASGPAPAITFLSRTSTAEPWTPTSRSFWGDAVDVRLSGLSANQPITVHAHSGGWHSWASFRTQTDGTIDLASAASEAGTYSGTDPDGMFWSMRSNAP